MHDHRRDRKVSEAGAKSVAAAGAQVHCGDLTDLESLRSGAAAADGVIHTGFNHDFSKFAENCENEKSAIEALGAALEGSDRLVLVTHLAPGRMATEGDAPLVPDPATYPHASEAAAAALVARGVRVLVVRLAPLVHGDGDHGFVPILVGVAREKGVSAYVRDGSNRWALCTGRCGSCLPVGCWRRALQEPDITESPKKSKTAENAANHFGWFTAFAALDMSASSQRTREMQGWQPKQPGFIANLDATHYFDTEKAA